MHPTTPPRVRSDTSRADVQRIMNEAQGEIYWLQSSRKWQNLLTARNEFTRARLHEYGLTTSQYKLLPKTDKRHYTEMIEVAFTADDGFYQYTRDGYWMQAAVGEQNNWINIEGMARWHIRQALGSLEARSNSSATPPFSPEAFSSEPASSSRAPPFDPIQDCVLNNLANR